MINYECFNNQEKSIHRLQWTILLLFIIIMKVLLAVLD